MKTALICGISGQDGAYLARLLLDQGYRVVGTSRDAQTANFRNLDRLGIRARVAVASMVLTDFRSTLQTLARIAPDEIYNLAGQTSVGLSFEQPVETLESIATGTLNLLEAIRFLDRPIRLYNAGSSECFGDTGGVAATEDTPFRPRSPYAVAKATAHWEVANYREAYGLFACSGILFNHESPLRPSVSLPVRLSPPPAVLPGVARKNSVLVISRCIGTGAGRLNTWMPCGACSNWNRRGIWSLPPVLPIRSRPLSPPPSPNTPWTGATTSNRTLPCSVLRRSPTTAVTPAGPRPC